MHCYRMLGSVQDAEDAVQDTLLAAWQGFAGFEGRASIRTWLYRIATNRCLNARRAASRRPASQWNIPGVEPPEPTRMGEVVWLEPLPDALLAGAPDVPPGPEARYEQTESISLAFVTALQLLPPRQLAVLILRDVLGFRASEVAGMLDASVESVNSALKRARATLERHQAPGAGGPPPPASGSAAEDEVVARFVQRLRVRRPRRGGGPADRRRLRLDAADPLRVRGPGRRGPLLRQHPRLGPEVRAGADCGPTASRRSAPTCAARTASAARRACSSSPWPATGSAR